MATDLGGRWITTDSGQHVFIKAGGGSVRAQVKAHFAAQGQPGHPDIAKKVTEHPAGHDPRTGVVKGPSLREQVAQHREGSPLTRAERAKTYKGLRDEGFKPTNFAGKQGGAAGYIRERVKARQAARATAPKEEAKDTAESRMEAEHARRVESSHAQARKIEGKRQAVETRRSNQTKAMHDRAEATTPVRLSTTTVTVVKSPRARSLTAQLVLDDMKRQREGMSSNPAAGKAAPTSTLRERLASTSTQRTAGIKAAQPGYREGTTTLREKVANARALRYQAEMHRVNPKARGRQAEGLWEQRQVERGAVAAAPGVAHPSGRVYLSDLRKAVGSPEKPVFDAAMLRAQKRGKVILEALNEPKERISEAASAIKLPTGDTREILYMDKGKVRPPVPPVAARAKATLREQIAKAKAEGRLAPGRGTEERETLAAARLKARAKYPVKGGAATPSPAAHPTGAAFADRVKASAAKVGPEGRFGSSKVYVADAHKAYEADHGKIPIADFKSRLAEANQGRHIDLSRADLVEAMPQSKLVASQIKHQGAEFHFIRTTPLASESKGFSPGAEAPKAGASIDLSGHRAKLSEALTGSPSRQLDKLHELRGEVFQSSLKGGGATKETMSLRSEIQGHMDRIERGMSKPSGSVLDKETADEIARNKRVPLKGQGDFTSKASGELSETHGRVLGALKGGPKDFRTLRDELGHKTLDPQNPLKNPVHAAAKELRDKGLIEATESRFGSATVKLTAKGEDALKIAKPTAIRERIASTAAQQTGGIKAGQAGFREKLSARGVADSEATTSPTWKSGSSKIRSRLQTKGEVARESETIGRENTATFRKNLQGVSRSDLPDEEKVARFRRLKNAVTGSTERADNMRAEIDTKIHAFSSTGKTPAAPTSTFTQRTSGVAVGQSGFKQKLSAMLAARKPAPAPGGFGLRSAPNGGTRKLF